MRWARSGVLFVLVEGEDYSFIVFNTLFFLEASVF